MDIVEEPKKRDWNFRLVRYFLKNKQLTILVFAVIVLGGVFAFSRFRVEGFPKVEVPLAIVTTIVPGAGPETVDQLVTVPITAKLQDVENVTQISSSSSTGVSSILIQLNEGTDTATAVQEIRTQIDLVSLPQGTPTPDVFVPETGSAPFVIAVAGNMSLEKLIEQSKILENSITGVSEVSRFSQTSTAKPTIYIDIPKGADTQGITNQIQAGSQGFPLGEITIGDKRVPISGAKQIRNLDDLKNFTIASQTPAGAVTRKLSEIANVYENVDTKNQINRVGFRDGNTFRIQSGLLYSVELKKDADLLETEAKIKDAISEAQGKSEAKYVLVYNEAKDSAQQISELIEGALGGQWDIPGPLKNAGYLFGGIWLLVLVMLLFLDWRSALLSATSIPLSFLFTFLCLQAFGIQLNTIVLFSLILVLGLIVDPAIVVLESIKRYTEVGYKGTEAVLRSVDIIGQGLFMAVLTSLVVFLPFGIVSGVFGQIIKYIPLTVIPALLASYFVPMLFLTWLAGKYLKPKEGAKIKDENDPAQLWAIARWLISANRFILRKPVLGALVVIFGLLIPVGVAGALISSGKIKQVQFGAPSDTNFLLITVPLPQNSTPNQLAYENAKLENTVKNYAQYIQQYFYQGSQGSSFSVFVELVEAKDRDKKSPEIAKTISEDLVRLFGEQAIVQEIASGPPEESFPVTVKIFDNDATKLKTASVQIASKLRDDSEVTAVRTDNERTAQEFSLQIDAQKAAGAGLNAAAAYAQIAATVGTRKILTLEDTDVIIRTPQEQIPTTEAALNEQLLYAGGPNPVTLGTVGQITLNDVPGLIKRIDGQRYAEVSARVKDSRSIIAVQRTITDWAKTHTDELGLSSKAFENRAAADGFEKSFQQLFLAIAVAIVISYLAFVLFFKSFIQPLIILFAIPLIAVGVFPALVVFANGQLGFLEIIGVIMVIGIVENVGIFLIDFANRKVAEGMDPKEAIALSSGIRFRAVILTKLTALAGLLPLAIFAPFWRGLAVVVIMGIISSGILSLFTTPVLYAWFTKKSAK